MLCLKQKQIMNKNQFYWFTGQAGAGKTSIAKELKRQLEAMQALKVVMLDGDDIREVYENSDYSIEGRRANVDFVMKLCGLLIKNNIIPIVSMVSPFADQRAAMKEKYNGVEIYVHTTEVRGREHYHVDYFEKPIGEHIDIDTTDIAPITAFDTLWKSI